MQSSLAEFEVSYSVDIATARSLDARHDELESEIRTSLDSMRSRLEVQLQHSAFHERECAWAAEVREVELKMEDVAMKCRQEQISQEHIHREAHVKAKLDKRRDEAIKGKISNIARDLEELQQKHHNAKGTLRHMQERLANPTPSSTADSNSSTDGTDCVIHAGGFFNDRIGGLNFKLGGRR